METVKSTVGITNGYTMGAGVVINDNGDVLTCAHVIDSRYPSLYISFNGSTDSFKYKVVIIDTNLDLALLTPLEAIPEHIRPVIIASGAHLGDKIYSVGHPFGITYSMSFGHISNVTDIGWQTDNATNRGNSGGGLFNTKGELIGITSHIFTRDGYFIGIAYSTDITRANVQSKFKLHKF
jgi:serine protease Do